MFIWAIRETIIINEWHLLNYKMIKKRYNEYNLPQFLSFCYFTSALGIFSVRKFPLKFNTVTLITLVSLFINFVFFVSSHKLNISVYFGCKNTLEMRNKIMHFLNYEMTWFPQVFHLFCGPASALGCFCDAANISLFVSLFKLLGFFFLICLYYYVPFIIFFKFNSY